MAHDTQLLDLYGKLRVELLTRHFAYGRYFRANLISESGTKLGNLPGVANCDTCIAPAEIDDPWKPPKKLRMDNYTTLLALPEPVQMRERWRIGRHDRDNPLLWSGILFTCLAIEHHLASSTARNIIWEGLKSIGSLYKFTEGHFKGYILRWDPVTSDKWITRVDNDKVVPLQCCEFLTDAARQYLYCTPLDHPAYIPPVDKPPDGLPDDHPQWQAYRARTAFMPRYRFWEPSMEELAGLILAYDVIHRFLYTDYEIKAEVERQVNMLGDYLAEHGYILVRPCGGFTARGASGVLPALEFPFTQVFQRITGKTYESRASFDGAMEKAGVWESLKGPLRCGAAIGSTLGVAAALGLVSASLAIGEVLGGITGVLSSIIGVLAGIGVVRLGYAAGRAVALLLNQGIFDVSSDQGEFALADLWKVIPSRKLRFLTWILSTATGLGGHARMFPAYIGLTGLGDPDTTVKDSYITWFSGWPFKYGESITPTHTGLKRGVAAVLGEGPNSERLLREFLDQFYSVMTTTGAVPISVDPKLNPSERPGRQGHLTVENSPEDENKCREQVLRERPIEGIDFMVGLALAWLHAKRSGDVPNGIPNPPSQKDLDSMPRLEVPFQAYSVLGPIGGAIFPDVPMESEPPPATVFGNNTNASKPPDPPPPTLPPPVRTESTVVDVPESAPGDVFTGIYVDTYDTISIFASGSIESGVWLTGPNGPAGWNNLDHDPKFPINRLSNGVKIRHPKARPYCLLYRIGVGPYQYAGTNANFEVPEGVAKLPLYLRINDDRPGNGKGAFRAVITVIHRAP
ncbi:MAG TPA: hypothetical protein VFL17_11275 [Anaerolineae bacterium]|nr:hypothetical protein [Anaerolineae bacterium]